VARAGFFLKISRYKSIMKQLRICCGLRDLGSWTGYTPLSASHENVQYPEVVLDERANEEARTYEIKACGEGACYVWS
jgi:hypothetical protein